VTLHKLVDS